LRKIENNVESTIKCYVTKPLNYTQAEAPKEWFKRDKINTSKAVCECILLHFLIMGLFVNYTL